MYKENLKTILMVRNLRPAELARRSGLPRQTINRWLHAEDNWVNVESRCLMAVAKALDVPANDLLTPLPDLTKHYSPTLFFWDRLYPDFISFAVALGRFSYPAVGRLVQTLGLFKSEKILGIRVWKDFSKYKKFIHPVVRKNWEAVWITQKNLNLI